MVLIHFTGLLGPAVAAEGQRDDNVLKSEMLVKDNRRYYLDLKENKRGRFLRVNIQLIYYVNCSSF